MFWSKPKVPLTFIGVTCTDWLLAKAQIGLAFYFCTAIFGMVFALIFFRHNIDPAMLNFVTGIITSLTTLLATIVGFFFGRKAAQALPDPSTTTTTTTSTTAPTPGSTVPPLTSAVTIQTSVPAADTEKP
ncbi:MAG TPA: hypothetical protein VMS08_00935 [Candidatus Saccharimonadia bacterium]|nr:hypothetical protein [Candidatus Saccharimonadia bacterium]